MNNIINILKKTLFLAVLLMVYLLLPSITKADYLDNLDVTCYPTTTVANTGDVITWRASAFGGNGNYYVTWDGTNGLSGSGSNIDIVYYTSGVKSASVRVTSGGQSVSRNCNSVKVYGSDINDNRNDRNYDYDYDYNRNRDYYDYNRNRDYDYERNYNSQLSVTCSANTSFAPVGTVVSWQAYASGGNGKYSYSWYGSDSINGYNRSLDIFYNSPGIKNASITVRSGSKSVTQACSNTVTVGQPINYYNYNQPINPIVPSYTAPKTIIKYVEVPAKKTVTKTTVKDTTEKVSTPETKPTTSLSSYADVPWGWVAVMVIIVLLSMIMYLVFNSKKI